MPSHLQMEELAKGEALSQVVAAYARPTRIVRGKELDSSWQVDEALFAVPEESTLFRAYKLTASQLHPGVGMDVFVEASQALIEPLEAFFTNVFVMAVSVYYTVIFCEYLFDLFF
jgi:glycyl-tRNA synthetase